ncbi:hypothetical protein FRC01_002392 [Tulasnella sp. 417]|nr:hypothetical protein FRC01_002392 [Tulasnella sp. 417]
MDIDHPDPGTSPQLNFFVETPFDADTLAFAAPNGAAAASAMPPAYSSIVQEAGTSTSHANGFVSEDAGVKERSDQSERMDEDTQESHSAAAGSDTTLTAATENGTQDTNNKGPLDTQDAHMTDQSGSQPSLPPDQSLAQSSTISSSTTLQDSNDAIMSDGSPLSDGQGSRTPSGECRSSDSGIGGSDGVEDSDTTEKKGHISAQISSFSTSQYSSYLPPQPYGFSPYPPVAEATASSDIAPTKPLPPSPTISYASTEDLGEPDRMATEDANAGLSSTSHNTNFAKGVDLASDVARQQYEIPPLSSFGAQVPYGNYDPGTRDNHHQNHLDLLPRIKGLFRLLDLYSETTNSGLVDKIIISQASLGEFINRVLPGAYTDVTKIDFKRLDREARLPLVGIYGSKSEIIRFLQAAGSIDDDVAGLLQLPEDISIRTRPVLRSGIYMLDPPNSQSEIESSPPTRYVIYWPENTTWDDSSSGSVRKNRVTFMRYLTCLTDQIRCLISPEHEKMLVFDNGDDDGDSDDGAFESNWGDQDDGKVNDRFFKFEVAKTNEQEEDAHIGEGFKIEHQTLTCVRALHPSGRSMSLEPRLLAGETVQAFSTLRFNEGVDREISFDGFYNPYSLKYLLGKYPSILIPDTIEETDLSVLLDKGDLERRLPLGMNKAYKKDLEDVRNRCDAEEKKNVAQGLQSAKESQPKLKSQVRLFVVYRLLETYSYLEWEMLEPGESQRSSENEGDPLDYFNFIRAASSLVKEALDAGIKEAKLGVINFEAYRRLKRPFSIVRNILDKHANLTDEQRDVLVQEVSQEDSTFATSGSSTTGWKKFNPLNWGKALLPKLGITNEDETESLIKLYSQVDDEPDPLFLSSLADVSKRHRILSDCVYRLKSLATEGLRQKLGRLADTLVQKLGLAYERQIKQQCDLQAKARKQNEKLDAFVKYRREVQHALAGNQAGPTLIISWIKQKYHWASSNEVEIKASTRQRLEPTITVGLWILDLPEDDKQRVRDDPGFVPIPRIPQRPQLEQQIPLNWNVRRVQMLGPKKCLLVIDGPDKTRIWIFSPHAGLNLDAPNYHIASLSDRKYVIAVDEQKKLLAFVITGPASCVLQQYLIDIESSTIHGRGSPFNLVPWYDHTVPKISHAAFFSGTDDLCLVESSSPDGSALLVLEGPTGAPRTLRVFHHASFGFKPFGIDNALPDSFGGVQSFSITSIGERGRVFILGLNPSAHTIVSVGVDISRKETEYQFRAKSEGPKPHPAQASSASNVLVTCFSEVWDRFPVMAAIQRMIRTFEETSKKPTGQRLASIHVSSSTFDDAEWETPPTSMFKAGEWIVELLCLIPIHIAVADENRFVPLKDGVRDHAVERELLGAEVSRIIDSISLGWYESIFSVYMASKRVKVISSMGEQSVGKSYSLNHMVDSSFAGSAVRTTESFQASTHLFDPKSNPKLFKGLLAIVIKDVVDADKKDIVKEFSSKFGQIVSKEQASNFITVLHDSQLTVIPWSVILSPDFYRLFGKLGKTLFNQKITHDSAGEFLITLKTLMAKMKAQDWGSLDHTVIKHRVTAITKLLPNVLALGRLGPEADGEELRNMDNQIPIIRNDTSAVFCLGKDDTERSAALSRLVKDWNSDAARRSTSELVQHLQDVAECRIATARKWMQENVSRFPEDNADMRALKRRFEDLSEALQANIQLCLAECTFCRLRVSTFVTMITTSKNPAGSREGTGDVISVIHHPTCVANLAISAREMDAKDTVSNKVAKSTASICVPHRSTSVERHAIYVTFLWRTGIDSHAIRLVLGPITKITPAMSVIIAFLARLNASFVQGFALWKATSTAWTGILFISAGHPQAEHDTAHGSMELTAWAVEGNVDAVVEVQGRKFAAQETGAPQLCSSICRNLGRHAHIDYCRNVKGGEECRDAESEHIKTRMLPHLDRPKDWISHREFWARAGFKDPYSNDEQTDFALCNVQCAGPEHEATAHAPARPSYCKLPIFHSPQLPDWSAPGNDSYISGDGHFFECPNPNNLRQAFHVMFVLDRSGSMGGRDRSPLPGQPVTATISQHNNNRFGAVLSALYGFWISRGSGNQGGRRDAYSVILFDSSAQVQFANDLNSTPDQLLNLIVRERIRGGTNFDGALLAAQTTMETHWSTESDNVIHDICNRAVARGKPLSFHSVSFGTAARSASLRRMVTIAEQVAANAPPNPLNPLVPCGYTDVMDTIRLAETFLNIADSLKKPRAALLRS